MSQTILHCIDGCFTEGIGTHQIDVFNPATAKKVGSIQSATSLEVEFAIASAKRAFQTWKQVPIPERARLMLRYQQCLKDNLEALTQLVMLETGKIHADARGDVWRGIEVVEHACQIGSLMMGETYENVAQHVNTYSYMQPLGVCAGITPFNFPAMIPLWMFPLAIACGNTFVLKPSEQTPLTPTRLVALFYESGAPDSILQLVHGHQSVAEVLTEHPDIKAVSFVGSTQGAQAVYQKATSALKRVQACGGAKNHAVVMPDAHKNKVIEHLVSASFGAAGQRCMALSAAVFVGKSAQWIPELKAALTTIKPGLSSDPNAAFGPLISSSAKQRVVQLIQSGINEGARCLLDGRTFEQASGNWLGPTLFDKVQPSMKIYQEEIFGPVLSCLEVPDLDQAIELINSNPYGNGTAIFTQSGFSARHFQTEVDVGQVGINVPIPVPMPAFSFTGWKRSFYGDQHTYGKQAVRFYTETKTITSRWFECVSGQPKMTLEP
jgi:malonate-semialdehyde dehydrogenase (acetylating)/methylmalonate-semialdehyde dehydrogenase